MIESVIEEKSLYSDVGGWLCLDFVNTVNNYHSHTAKYDYLETYEHLALWARQAGLITAKQESALRAKVVQEPKHAHSALERARKMRDSMHWVFSAASDGTPVNKEKLGELNAEIALALPHARLVQAGDSFEWDWVDFPSVPDSLLWPIAKSAADLLTSEKLERVRECASDTCGWLFIDTSKNHSRRWCDMRDCGNSAKAKRHYHKTKVATT